MGNEFGGATSKTLQTSDRNFVTPVFRNGVPPLDSEMNLPGQLIDERLRTMLRAQMPSGFVMDPGVASLDYRTDASLANGFYLGVADSSALNPVMYAVVNGWVVPVAGSDVVNSVENFVKLNPPPGSGARVDLVFLEVWAAVLNPNPSTDYKPSASTIWRYGNTQYGGTNLPDDIKSSDVGFQTTRRVQIQYRIRTFGSSLSGVDLETYPEGLDDPSVVGWGAVGDTVSGSYPFINMADTLGDQGLWRSGPGLLGPNSHNPFGTLDGYTYAIPIAAVYRRNQQPYGVANQNGAFCRNPSGTVAHLLNTVTLAQDLSPTDTGTISMFGVGGSGFDDAAHYSGGSKILARIGSEIVEVSGYGFMDLTITARGRAGTVPTGHLEGTTVEFWSYRPDGLFSDQIGDGDLVDLRHAVSASGFDFSAILMQNLSDLITGRMRTAPKTQGEGAEQGGVEYLETACCWADGGETPPVGTKGLDGPDGIRYLWSDAAVVQRDVTVCLDPANADGTTGFTTTTFDQNVAWEAGATTLKASGFIPDPSSATAWKSGTVIRLYLGGEDESSGARATFRDGSTRAVRFLGCPEDYVSAQNNGRQSPVTMRFMQRRAMYPDLYPNNSFPGESEQHPGPFYALENTGFVRPFIWLGGLANPVLRVTIPVSSLSYVGGNRIGYINLGSLDFDSQGGYWVGSKRNLGGAGQILYPLQYDERVLYDLLSAGGKDDTGHSSELFAVVVGDASSAGRYNNGAFRVIGAGTSAAGGYTLYSASTAGSIVVETLDPNWGGFDNSTGETITVELRTMRHDVRDGSDFASGIASSVVVITDLTANAGDVSPWDPTTLGALAIGPDLADKMVLNLSLLYHPNRGATSRVANEIKALELVEPGAQYLRQPLSVLDADLNADTGYPENQVTWDPAHVSLWAENQRLGLDHGALNGEGKDVSNQCAREHEFFCDPGSKSVVFRPYQMRSMTMHSFDCLSSLFGSSSYPNAVPIDGAGIFPAGARAAVPIPPEWCPTFGRQDIPMYQDRGPTYGTGTFLNGLNHLFADTTDPTNPVFEVIGGTDNTTGGNLVTTMLFQTGAGSGLDYGEYGTLISSTKDAYQARLRNDPTVLSEDFGIGLRSIELPPFLGIARLIGVYERTDYLAKGGATYQSDRVTPAADPATNLLRTDQSNLTLWIQKDGAEDLYGDTGAHTYCVPSNVIDLSKIAGYDGSQTFDSYDYVVECTVFGFALGFIDYNSYVLLRKHNGQGVVRTDSSSIELSGARMVIPSPATLNDELLVHYTRTPYQGDPFGTRLASTYTGLDVETRYGQVDLTSAYELNEVRDQSTVQAPNPRTFDVLASADLYMTCGTGKIGGFLRQGSPLDVGYLPGNRLPSSLTQNPLSAEPHLFTEGQQHAGTRARYATARITPNRTGGISNGDKIRVTGPEGQTADFTAVDTPTNASASEFQVPTLITNLDGSITYARTIPFVTFSGPIADGDIGTATVTINHLGLVSGMNAVVSVSFAGSPNPGVLFSGYVSGTNTVTLQALNATGSPLSLTSIGLLVTITLQNQWDASVLTILTRNLFEVMTSSLNPQAKILGDFCEVRLTASNEITLTAKDPGVWGNTCTISYLNSSNNPDYSFASSMGVPSGRFAYAPVTVNFTGGEDVPINAGDGVSPIALAGATERFPMGILFQDSDFAIEDPLQDGTSQLFATPTALRSGQSTLTIRAGSDYTPTRGVAGERIAMADGAVLSYAASSTRYRTYRGGTVWSLTKPTVGGPVQISSESLSPGSVPILKSSILVGKAFLVRNYPEVAFSTDLKRSHGGELQMVVVTRAIEGSEQVPVSGLRLQGQIGAAGHGEGYCAADRYRISGHPLAIYRGEIPDPQVSQIAPYQKPVVPVPPPGSTSEA